MDRLDCVKIADTVKNEVISVFEGCGALQTGHFVLRSGLHSGHYFQCARVGEDMKVVTRLAEMLIEKLEDLSFTTVLAPAMGALLMGHLKILRISR